MNIKQIIGLAGLIVATAGVSPLVLAQDSGWYIGASTGQTNAKDFCPSQIPVGSSCDDTSGAYSVFGGYQVIKYLGVEAGYTNLGDVKVSASGTTNTFKAKGAELLGVGTIPINSWLEVYGKVGVFFWDADRGCAGTSCMFGSKSETGSDLTYGLGAKFNFSKYVGVRVQFQRYQDVGDKAPISGSDIDFLSVGIVFKF